MAYKTTLETVANKSFIDGVFVAGPGNNICITDSNACNRTIITNFGKRRISIPKHSMILSYYPLNENKAVMNGVSLGQISIEPKNKAILFNLFNINCDYMGYCGVAQTEQLDLKDINKYISMFWLSSFPYYKKRYETHNISRTVDITSIFNKQDLTKLKKLYGN